MPDLLPPPRTIGIQHWSVSLVYGFSALADGHTDLLAKLYGAMNSLPLPLTRPSVLVCHERGT